MNIQWYIGAVCFFAAIYFYTTGQNWEFMAFLSVFNMAAAGANK